MSVDTTLQDLAEICMIAAVSHLPASHRQLEIYKNAQSEDTSYQQIIKYCREGWPCGKKEIDASLKPYWEAQGELTVGNELLMHGHRLVVPKTLQTETLAKLHEGHQGIVRCHMRAKMSVWWPGLSKELIKKCPDCARDTMPSREPLIPTSLPQYPWQ